MVTPSSVNVNTENETVAPDESVSMTYTDDGNMNIFNANTFHDNQEKNTEKYKDELIVKDFVKKAFFPHVS